MNSNAQFLNDAEEFKLAEDGLVGTQYTVHGEPYSVSGGVTASQPALHVWLVSSEAGMGESSSAPLGQF